MTPHHDIPARTDQRSAPDKRRAGGAATKGDSGGREKTGASPGRTIETPGQPGLEKEPNRDKAVGPGGQRLTSGGQAAGRDVDVPGVDRPDGINSIDPNGETKAEEDKLL